MKFKSIFIANLSEVAIPLIATMAPKEAEAELFEDHALCDRFLFFGEDNRVLVTPFSIDPIFFKDFCKILGFKNVVNYFLDQCSQSICESILKDQKLIDQLETIIKENPGIKIYSYAGTEEFIKLVKLLKLKGLKFETPEIPEENNRWTQSFFGSKAGFRQAAAILGDKFPKMPEGAICSSNQELNGWIKNFADTGYVQKHNRGLAGAGLKIVKKDEVKLEAANEKDWPVVVERFIDPDLNVCGGSPNIELCTKGNKVVPLYTCAMRVTSEGVFRGIEIGKGAVEKDVNNLLKFAGVKWGKYLVEKGYRGFFEIDFVAGKNKKIYPIEANLRRTGGTHVFETTKRLLGNSWEKNYIVARNVAETKFTNYLDLKNAVQSLYYKNGEGVIITVINLLHQNKLGYIVIGRNKKRALEIEKKFYESCV